MVFNVPAAIQFGDLVHLAQRLIDFDLTNLVVLVVSVRHVLVGRHQRCSAIRVLIDVLTDSHTDTNILTQAYKKLTHTHTLKHSQMCTHTF